VAVALALACGCTCQGKGHAGPGAAAQNEAPAKAVEEPVQVLEAKSRPYEKGRFDVERTGFVEATLGGTPVLFTVLPPTQNRIAFAGKPPLVVVDAYAAEGGKEHLRVHIQGVAVERWKGRTLTQTDDKAWLVAVTYQDAHGKSWVGRAGRASGVQVAIVDVEARSQLVSGTFSGQLQEADGDAVLEVAGGSFRTERPD
jgi:hypothetical protein